MYPRTVVYRGNKSVVISAPPNDLPEPKLTENAKTLLARRYAHEGESPKDIYWRVADFVSFGSEQWLGHQESRKELAHQYYLMMANGLFLPNTPTIANAGRHDNAQLAACFVLPIKDSMESIFETLKRTALIHKTGGGTGFSFSNLRPKNNPVTSTQGVASGPVSFMTMYNWVTEVVKQGGLRRGANMGILRVDHPDIIEFVDSKVREENNLANFNISVAVTDSFLEAVKNDTDYSLIDPSTNKEMKSLKAREVWKKIIENAWRCGDPGLFFIDKANNSTANPIVGWKISATNPCGEQPIYDNDACNLGSICLSAFFIENKEQDWEKKIDWENLKKTEYLAVQFLDDVVTMSTYPLPEITEIVDSLRRIGLGPMGLSNLLQLLQVPYDCDTALEINERIAIFMKAVAVEASQTLAKIRGSFPLFEKSIFASAGEKPRRNCNVTTVAPTGSLSRLTDCEGGIEPPFSLSYFHGVQNLYFVNNTVVGILKNEGLWDEKVEKAIKDTGSVQKTDLPDHFRDVFKTALEIDPKVHVLISSIWQKHYSESGVSKTVNLPQEATEIDVAEIYDLAYTMDCKGITIFRNGCERASMMTVRQNTDKNKTERPFLVSGSTFKIKTPYGNAYFTFNTDDRLFEGFLSLGKAGNEVSELTEWAMRLFSLIGRMPSPWTLEERIEEIIKQSKNIGGKKGLGPDNEKLVRAIPDGIAYCCQEFLEGNGIHFEAKNKETVSGRFCPNCQSSLLITEGCRGGKCVKCDYSSC